MPRLCLHVVAVDDGRDAPSDRADGNKRNAATDCTYFHGLLRTGWQAMTRLILAAVAFGFGLLCWGVAKAAEQREPFKYALVMQLPGKPQEVRHLFDSETACVLDATSTANVAPKGTRLSCVRMNDGKRVSR